MLRRTGRLRRITVHLVALTEITTSAEVLLATDHDPYARGSLRRPMTRGWVGQGVAAWVGVDSYERVPYFSALGAPADVGGLVAELLPELPHRQRVTFPRGTGAHLPAWVGLENAGNWDFRWLDAPPPEQPGEDRVIDPVDPDEVTALLAVASPTASALPGDAEARAWVGIADPDGGLLACAADTTATTGVGHLSSIAVHPEVRGQGLGKAVVAFLVRRLLADGCDVVTLGMYADNVAGRALYDSLGFAEHRFTSGQLLVRSRW